MKKNIPLISLLIVLLLLTAACTRIAQTMAEPEESETVTAPVEEPSLPEPEPEPPQEEPAPVDAPAPPPPGPPAEFNFRTNTADELVYMLSYMTSPIKGRTVSNTNGQLPNAPRRYRNGVHEGLDYYNTIGYTVYAAAAGTVIRADHDYVEMTLEEYEDAIRISAEAAVTPAELLDKFRGKQVWIEHKDGVVTRYAHLSEIFTEITPGIELDGGQAIAIVGNTGMRANITGQINSASDEPHLHFEIWLGDTFLGKGRPAEEVRSIYKRILD